MVLNETFCSRNEKKNIIKCLHLDPPKNNNNNNKQTNKTKQNDKKQQQTTTTKNNNLNNHSDFRLFPASLDRAHLKPRTGLIHTRPFYKASHLNFNKLQHCSILIYNYHLHVLFNRVWTQFIHLLCIILLEKE